MFEEYFATIIKNYIKHPDDLVIHEDVGQISNNIRIKANPEDVGLIIGKGGTNITALKNIAFLVGMKHSRKIHINVID
jgi:predicted RNA-binding protein YlqC (UPF0109 family)